MNGLYQFQVFSLLLIFFSSLLVVLSLVMLINLKKFPLKESLRNSIQTCYVHLVKQSVLKILGIAIFAINVFIDLIITVNGLTTVLVKSNYSVISIFSNHGYFYLYVLSLELYLILIIGFLIACNCIKYNILGVFNSLEENYFKKSI